MTTRTDLYIALAVSLTLAFAAFWKVWHTYTLGSTLVWFGVTLTAATSAFVAGMFLARGK